MSISHRGKVAISLFMVLSVLTGILAIPGLIVGCQSQPVAYTNTATPLSVNLIGDFDAYTVAEKDDTVRVENTELSTAFQTAIAHGDAKVAASKWFGTGNIRGRLFTYWNADPKFLTPGGVELLQIKIHNAEAFDYILTVGNEQQSAVKSK